MRDQGTVLAIRMRAPGGPPGGPLAHLLISCAGRAGLLAVAARGDAQEARAHRSRGYAAQRDDDDRLPAIATEILEVTEDIAEHAARFSRLVSHRLRRHLHPVPRPRRVRRPGPALDRALVPASHAKPLHPDAVGEQDMANVIVSAVNAAG